MVKNYKSFQIKSKIRELTLLLEGNLEFSSSFKDKLSSIRTRSKLADDLLYLVGKEFNDKDLKYNYLDTTDSEDKVSFISQDKLNSIISRSDLSGLIDPYQVKGRIDVNVGRCVRAIGDLGNFDFSDKDLEQFVNLYKSKSDVVVDEEVFEIVSGEDIKYWYNEDNYYTDWGNGTLSKSCMRDEECQDFFDIYTGSNCKLLILTRMFEGEKKLIGRALVWKPIILKSRGDVSGKEYFMDRIYCMKDSDEIKFQEYSDRMGWFRKSQNNSNGSYGMMFIDDKGSFRAHIQCRVPEAYKYPYLDTLKFLNSSRELISNIGFYDGYILEDTEGESLRCDDCEGDGTIKCNNCGGSGDEECSDCRGYGNQDCYRCDGDGEVECRNCDGSGLENCSECNGTSVIECSWCDGSGENDEGVECVHCEGSGDSKCKECDSGKIDCSECDGTSKVECRDCNGKGKEECDECEGSGNITCGECGGEGDGECESCTGLIRKI